MSWLRRLLSNDSSPDLSGDRAKMRSQTTTAASADDSEEAEAREAMDLERARRAVLEAIRDHGVYWPGEH